MSELTITLLRLGFLIALWLFVFGILSTLRRDLTQGGRRVRPQRITKAPKTPKTPRRSRKGTHLIMTLATGEQRRLDLTDQPLTFGRGEDNLVVLDDDYTSTHHARITPQDRGWAIEDCGSTNGTWVDRKRITSATLIQPGQRIRVGKTELEVRA